MSLSHFKGLKFIVIIFSCALLLGFACCEHAMAQERLYHNEFPLEDVTLLNGPFKQARDLNIKTLLAYDVDRLLAPYRKEAGLKPKGLSYKNWDGLDGHVGGHYLSALAINYEATKNQECKKRLDYMLSELQACQQNNTLIHAQWGKGYVGGVPNSTAIWSNLSHGDFTAFHAAWVPWYNVHKIYGGLRDAWLYTGSEKAKIIFLKFCDWAIDVTAKLSDDQMQSMLDTEHGGMNEVLADAYQITCDEKYLKAAKRFSHHMLLDAMANSIDNLDNKHANTQVPKAVGFSRIGELSHDEKFEKAGSFFWQTVTSNRTLAFGGNSRREFFPSAASSHDFLDDVEGPESCNSYNMLKLTEDLFRQDPSARYIDYYERTVYNHILSTQDPVTGGYVYFTPVRPRSYKVYSTPNEAMWCCVGSGMENHGKYNQLIYTHRKDSLFLNLFVASKLNWKDKGIKIRQETQFPDEARTRIKILSGSSQFTLMVRHPAWVTAKEFKIIINGKVLASESQSSSYVAVSRKWKAGDIVEIVLPMHNTIEHLPNVPNYVAVLHGPILLSAKTGTEDLKGLYANDSRWGHIPSGKKLPLDKAPIILADNPNDIAEGLVNIKGEPLDFNVPKWHLINPAEIKLEPFYRIHDARYMMYWMTLTNQQYKSYLDSLAIKEKLNIALQKRTIDFVKPGEQQPEVDHQMQSFQSRVGSDHDEVFREAFNGGDFSYSLATNKEKNISLIIKSWVKPQNTPKFEIYVDDVKIATVNNLDKPSNTKFIDTEYPIPDQVIKGKEYVRVKIKALEKSGTGPIYYIRLTRKEAD